ncbi:FecR domain-containing protein [Pseudomonas sp. LS44]|uniref:FecR family protein n=1 Tax=Pseudomonas sp. LS44 TaxID=1357074 RepID=UPI00215A8BBE|nr:FecR domain-containing protein [Pseudomonas sp. LS44]UVE19534.1 FecR domain-containing protein [Pseudomonas sp. LS44]
MSDAPRKPNEFTQEDEAIASFREELKKRFPLPTPQSRPKKRAAGAALGLLLLGLSTGLAWFDPAYRIEDYASAVGQRQTLQLADGSQVLLDSASKLVVSWHLRSRQVELQAGQALFDVAPMRYRPFLVDAGTADVKVVGTRFNVSRRSNDVLVTVAEGKVAVHGHAAPTTTFLEPGQQLRVHAGLPDQAIRVNVEDVIAWQDNRLVFESTPLSDVLEVVQRYHPAPIQLVDRSLAGLPISGVFDSEHVDSLISLLPSILPVSVSTGADGAVLIRDRAGKK